MRCQLPLVSVRNNKRRTLKKDCQIKRRWLKVESYLGAKRASDGRGRISSCDWGLAQSASVRSKCAENTALSTEQGNLARFTGQHCLW